jgi:ribulose-phosphate 3-epimerase
VLGAQAGLALNPGTPAEAVAELREIVDLVLIMSVNPGYAGQAFIASVLPKIPRVRALIGDHVPIAIDGGISPGTAAQAAAAGARILVAASAIFQVPEGIAAAVRRLRASAQ